MPRSIWNGTITFGLAHVPIKLYSATESKTVSFHEVHVSDGARIEHRRICSKEDKEVPYDEVVKGFEVSEDEYVVLKKDEVKAAAGGRGKVIEIEDFVPDDEIDPVFFEKTYYLGARDDDEAYRVFHEALKQTDRVGIGRFTYHNREYLAAVRALDDVMTLHTMRFADEIVRGDEIEVASPGKGPSKREVEMAAQLVDSLERDFDPSDYEDTYRKAVLELIASKASGKAIELVEHEPDEESSDLLAALQASLKPSKKKAA
jgi:DNA end-binding protein Ku